MIVLFPIFWLLLWAVVSVLSCAFLGLSPAEALRTGGLIFIAGGIGLPFLAWLTWRISHHLRSRR